MHGTAGQTGEVRSVKHAATLPAGFEDLEPYVAAWSLTGEDARFRKRLAASMHEIRAFYDAIVSRMEAVMEHLGHCPATGLPPADAALLGLALSYVEISRVFEVWNQQDVRADFFELCRDAKFGHVIEKSKLNCAGFFVCICGC